MLFKIRETIIDIGYIKALSAILLLTISLILPCNAVNAANTGVRFGSASYDSGSGGTFPIGVYVESDERTGRYEVNLLYDNKRLEYLSGATSVDPDNGVITISGNSIDAGSERYWLQFRTLSGGQAFIKVRDMHVFNADGRTDAMVFLPEKAPIYITGPDTVGYDVEAELEGTLSTNDDVVIEEEEESVFSKVIDTLGDIGYVIYDFITALVARPIRAVILVLSIIGFVIILYILIYYYRHKNSIEPKKPVGKLSHTDTDNRYNNIISSKQTIPPAPRVVDEKRIKDYAKIDYGRSDKPVIRIKDVTMIYNLSDSDASGLKEYIILWLKHQVAYNELYALRNVNFNIYKGEIVGIIGTNGSGKSTLLKIVSGVLKPTKGRVDVDTRKVQLLTLGTGFDMELTAKENVYLNGAIIGYSRAFLDAHYDEIVEFSELNDFMDQKVKNFSSGMVSRLGFAIATAGDAAEILILDEVLSVGDEFFRKKSLKRIKEMIHSGSTVLLVSHNMNTIIDNCNKCVWLDKGVVRMIDEPKLVCHAYRQANNQ